MRTLLGSLVVLAGLLTACGQRGGDDIDPAMAEYNEGLIERGDALPDITVRTLDGRTASTASMRGKTVLLNLWYYQ